MSHLLRCCICSFSYIIDRVCIYRYVVMSLMGQHSLNVFLASEMNPSNNWIIESEVNNDLVNHQSMSVMIVSREVLCVFNF